MALTLQKYLQRRRSDIRELLNVHGWIQSYEDLYSFLKPKGIICPAKEDLAEYFKQSAPAPVPELPTKNEDDVSQPHEKKNVKKRYIRTRKSTKK